MSKRTVCLLLAIVFILSMMQMSIFATGFTDVPAYSYYADAVDWAVANNITAGTSSSTFSPNSSLTRAQMVTFLWRLAGGPQGYQYYASVFTDVSSSSWYYAAVGWAVYYGITSGTSNNTFSPNVPVTNKETLTFMYRAANCNQVTAVMTTAGSLSNLNMSSSSWAYSACVWANNQGYLKSIPAFANGFLPDNTTTRAIAVYLLWEMKTGNSKVFIEVTAGTGISEVTLAGRHGSYVSGYYNKGLSLSVSCVTISGYQFHKWVENGNQIGTNNPSAISANGNRSWTAVGKSIPPANYMTAIKNAAIGELTGVYSTQNYQIQYGSDPDQKNGAKYITWYNSYMGTTFSSGTAWCAIFVSWCMNEAGVYDAFDNYYPESYCPYMISNAQAYPCNGNYGIWCHSPAASKVGAGDVVFFDNMATSGHVGIVRLKTSATTFRTVEGNCGNFCNYNSVWENGAYSSDYTMYNSTNRYPCGILYIGTKRT